MEGSGDGAQAKTVVTGTAASDNSAYVLAQNQPLYTIAPGVQLPAGSLPALSDLVPLTRAPRAGETLYYMTTAYRANFSGSDGTAAAEAFDAVRPYQVAEEEHPSWHVGDDGRYELAKGTPASSSSSASLQRRRRPTQQAPHRTANRLPDCRRMEDSYSPPHSATMSRIVSKKSGRSPNQASPARKIRTRRSPGNPIRKIRATPLLPPTPIREPGATRVATPRLPERARAAKAPRTPARVPRTHPRPSLAQANPTGPHSPPCSESQALRYARRASLSSIAASRSGSAAAASQNTQTPPQHTGCWGGVLRIGPWPCQAGSAIRASATSRGEQARRRAARRSAQKRRAPCSRPACARRRGSGPRRLHRGRAAPRRRGRTPSRRGSTRS